MNDVSISVDDIAAPSWTEAARVFALAALQELRLENWDLSIMLCSDTLIRELNRQYRDIDDATDVLSFALGEEYRDENGKLRTTAGDIVISLPALERNVADFGVGEAEELARLILHGILHLTGLDHENNDPEEPMLKTQEELLAKLPGIVTA